jgi:predicted ATPase
VNLPLERVTVEFGESDVDRDAWPFTVPSVAAVVKHGFDLGALTVLVGENGSGKSTIVEGLAMAYGLSTEGGSTGARHSTRPSESPLFRTLRLRRGTGSSRWGFFLRAETMHGFYTYLEANPSGSRGRDPAFHEMSHGESFIEVLTSRFQDPGLYLLDEPESALSFTGCLALVSLLARIGSSGTAQVIVATHSPIVAAIPGARILEVGDWGLREAAWDELELVQNWRGFLDDPPLYLRYLLDD